MPNDANSNYQDIEFIKYFSDMDDFREADKIKYPLEEVLLLVLCSVLSLADGQGNRMIFLSCNKLS